MTVLVAYHDDPSLKASVLDQLAEHQRLDQIIQGVYWQGGKGCAVGCLTHVPDGGHCLFPELWGIPEHLAYLIDSIFEALPAVDARDWPARIMGAVPVGADLGLVWPRFVVWMLTDSDQGVVNVADENGRTAIRAVADCYRRRIDGDEPSESDWVKAGSAASAAAWAARTSAWASAREASAAWASARAAREASAAWAAREAAARAARAARAASAAERAERAARAARASAWAAREADKLVALCETAPIPNKGDPV